MRVDAWMVFDPAGRPIVDSTRASSGDAIMHVVVATHEYWGDLRRKGYLCKPVIIRENDDA